MTWERAVTAALKENDVGTIAYLPDGATGSLIEQLVADEYFTTIRLAREEEGVGVLSGAWLGHERGALICQSSGLATAINALASLSKPARIPFLGLVTRRGDLGEFNLAQVPFGYGVGDVLDDIGIRNTSLDDPDVVEARIDMAAKTAFGTEEPYVVLLEATLTGAKDEF
ncbi:MAG: thiamine pyrophosphate-binding protein [Halobacteriota archaeon]